MITTRAKSSNSNSECQVVALNNSCTDKVIESESVISPLSRNNINSDKELFQNSVLNVHIHMPKCDLSNIKLLVPGLQPVVHFHFNEEPKSVKLIVEKDNWEDACKIQVYNSTSERENSLESDSKKTLRSSYGCVTDDKVVEIKSNKGNSETSRVSGRISKKKYKSYKCCRRFGSRRKRRKTNDSMSQRCEISKEISNWSLFKSDTKLTTAVVVVKDVLRTTCSKVEMCKGKNDGMEENRNISVKEQESFGFVSCSDSATNDNIDTKPFEAINVTPSTSSKILTRLAEGCNFSELLNRFQFKYGSYFGGSAGCSKTTDCECCSDSTVKGESELEKTESFNEKSLVELEKQNLGFSTSNLHEDLNKTGDSLITNSKENVESTDFIGSMYDDCLQSTNSRNSIKDTENLTDHFQDYDRQTDESGSTFTVQSCSGNASVHQETVGSSSVTSILGNEACKVSEIFDNSKFGVVTEKMEMQRTNKKQNKKRLSQNVKEKKRKTSKSQSKKSNKSSSAKKMNHKLSSDGEKSVAPDYIPLQASGPTKFGVSLLDRIQPFKQHDAKDFRNKMLFGDRVQRYSSPQQAQMYKLKKEAARHVKESPK